MSLLNFNWFKKLLLKERPDEDEPVSRVPYRPECPSVYGTSIWAVGGGKGGVGKSFIASSLGILLSKQGRKVLLVDADLGAANLHTFLGIETNKGALSGFLKEEISELRSTISKTQVPNLDLVSGSKDSLDAADISAAKLMRLKDALRKIEYDNVILDVGPGTSANLLDIFLMSNEGIILSTPEPTTIENNYRFLKCLFLRKIKTFADAQEDGSLKELLQKIFSDRWPQRVKTVCDILDQIESLDRSQGRMLRAHVAKTGLSMIMNLTRKAEDDDIGPCIKKACSDYFGVEIGYLGSVSYDDSVNDSIRKRTPAVLENSQCKAVRSLETCLDRLVNRPKAAAPANLKPSFTLTL